MSWEEATTDATGIARIEGLPERTFEVRVMHPEHGVVDARVAFLLGAPVTTLRFADETSVVGRTLDPDGRPAALATIRLVQDGLDVIDLDETRAVTSNLEGEFELPNVPEGRWYLYATHEAFAPSTVAVEKSQEELRVEVTLQAKHTLGGWVRTSSGAPMAEARVVGARDLEGSLTTGRVSGSSPTTWARSGPSTGSRPGATRSKSTAQNTP